MLALFLASLAAPAAATVTTTYYISSTGSDTAAGTSPSTAWRSLNRTTRGPALAPGDSILLERGSTWYDESLRISFLVGGTVGLVGILLALVTGDVLELVCFFLEEFVDLFLILDNSFGYDLSMLND